MISLAQPILSQLSVLKCCSVLMPVFMRIDALQPKNWHRVFQSRKEALVTSFKILDIPRCVQNGFLTVEHNTESKAIFSVLLDILKQMERPYPGLLQQMKPWSIVLNLRQKSQPMEWHCPQSSWKKKFKTSLSVGKARS